MAWVELTARRGQRVKHYYDADTNQYRAILTIHDQHYKDDFNDWMDVNPNLVADTGGFDRRCDTTQHIFQVASGGNRRWYPRRNVQTEYVDITGIEYWDVNHWRQINLPAAVWKSNGADWDMANLYASIANTWHQIKTSFILKNNTAPTRIRFAISFVGLSYDASTGELTSIADGQKVGYINKPTGFDANNTPIIVTNSYDGTYIEWSANVTGAVYPIYIDPTFTDGPLGYRFSAYDTWLDSTQPDATNGDSNGLAIRLNLFNSLIKFRLDDLAGLTINSANLYLHNGGATDANINIYRILSANNSWTETGATWNHQTGTTNWAGGHTGCGTSATDFSSTAMGSFVMASGDANGKEYIVSLGLTEFGNMVSANYGLVILGDNEFVTAYVYSSDDINNVPYYPKLVVDYTGTLTRYPFTDDFSSGNFNKWDGTSVYGAGTATISSGEATFNCPNGNDGGAPPPEDYAIAYFYIGTWPAGNILWSKVRFKFVGADTSLALGGGFFIDFCTGIGLGVNTNNRWNVEYYSASQETDDPAPYNGELPIKICGTADSGTPRLHGDDHWWISPDTWYEVKIKVDYSGTNPSATWFLDDEEKETLVDTSVLSVNATKPQYVRIGSPWFDQATKNKVVIDEFYIGETEEDEGGCNVIVIMNVSVAQAPVITTTAVVMG